MRSEQFVVPYGDHAETSLSFGEYQDLLEGAISWSRYFGAGLIHNLHGGPYGHIDTQLTDVDLKEYDAWSKLNYSTIESELFAGSGDDFDADRALNFHNFHLLNDAMLPMWHPVVHGEWDSETDRLDSIRTSQDALALEGLRLLDYKLAMIRGLASTGEDYYSSNSALDGLRSSLEGRLNEIDTGMELLEIARRVPGSYVIPAPLQFEHSQRTFNADFIFCDGQGMTIGVQSKTLTIKRNGHEVDGYDARSIVVVDGSVDLGNELIVRTERSNPDGSKNHPFRRVSWNGLISAHYILGTARNFHLGRNDTTADSLDMAVSKAREMVGDIKSMNEHGVRSIGSRVLHGLGYSYAQVQELLYADA